MIINAVRYRETPQAEWKAWRFRSGTGRYRSVLCLHGNPDQLTRVRAAIHYALAGEKTPLVAEASLQISGDDGDTWVVHRQTDKVRYLKNGQPHLEEDGWIRAVLDLDATGVAPGGVAVRSFELSFEGGRAKLLPMTEEGTQEEMVREVLASQIREMARECAKIAKNPAMGQPKVLSRAIRALEPLYDRHQEVKNLMRSLTGGDAKDSDHDKGPTTPEEVDRLSEEVRLINEIEGVARPLLGAGTKVKSLRVRSRQIEEESGQLLQDIGVEVDPETVLKMDWRKPLESLCRLEAYGKLVRASQGARKACEQKVEPALRAYTDAVREALGGDREILAELESCLASLSLQINAPRPGEPREPTSAESRVPADGGISSPLKTWFDRFKKAQEGQDQSPLLGHPIAADLDAARMAVEYTIAKLAELLARADQLVEPPESAAQRLDDSHEDLVSRYGRAKDHWYKLARSVGLPEDLDLKQLLGLVVASGRIASLKAEARRVQEEIKDLKGRFSRLSNLVQACREVSGSAKRGDLASPAILITEARDILSRKAARERNLARMGDSATRMRASAWVRGQLEETLGEIEGAWAKAFKEAGLAPLDIEAEDLPGLFQRAGLMRGLALVHGATGQGGPRRLFEEGEDAACTLYVWDETELANKTRLEVLKIVEETPLPDCPELRIFLLADPGMAKMMASLGVGAALPVRQDPQKTAPVQRIPEQAPVREKQSAALLDERARRALDILTGRDGGRR